MDSSHLTLFVESRPFEPFRLFIADGRNIDVTHPEMVMMAKHALLVWLFFEGGQLEVVHGDAITSLRTLGPVDPTACIPINEQE